MCICFVDLVFIYYGYFEINRCILHSLLQDRLSLKVPTHGGKLKKFLDAPMPREVRAIVGISLTMLDSQLLTKFVERYHKKSFFFHLPFCEMMITLDDVPTMFHLSLVGSFFIVLSLFNSYHVLLLYRTWSY